MSKNLDQIDLLYLMSKIKSMLYPVGTIYMTTENINPAEMFGGTWVAWGSGRVPVGVDTSQTEFNTVEKTGGHKATEQHTHVQNSHTHSQNSHSHGDNFSVATGGAHTHNVKWRDGAASGSLYFLRRDDPSDSYNGTNAAAMSGGSHSHTLNGSVSSATATNNSTTATNQDFGTGNAGNLQPFITCYMWKRTA
jgi:hypothetical protein